MKLYHSLRQRWISFISEWQLGIRTRGYSSAPVDGGRPYVPLPYEVVFRILKHLALKSEDVFIDVGCGKGRVTCCASTYSLQKVIALDLNETLVKAAIENARRMRGCKSSVVGVTADATQFNYQEVTVIYMYNPFGRDIMERMIAKVAESVAETPRRIRIVYANNLHEEPLLAQPWLEKTAEWEKDRFRGFGCRISFWATR